MFLQWPESQEWLVRANVVPKKYFGVEGNLQGPQIRALLKPNRFQHLHDIATESAYIHAKLFIDALFLGSFHFKVSLI